MDAQCSAVTEECAAAIVRECDEKLRGSFLSRSLSLSSSSSPPPSAFKDLSSSSSSPPPSASCTTGDEEVSVSVLKIRKRLLDRDLLALAMISVEESEVQDLEGRISGDVDWKLSRGEIGKCSVKSPSASSTATQGGAGVKKEGDREEEEEVMEEEEVVAEDDDDSCLALQFISLGGRVHEDTVAFDSTQCLWSLLQLLKGADEDLEGRTSSSSSSSSSSTSSHSTSIGQKEQQLSIKRNEVDKNEQENENENSEEGGELKVGIKVQDPSNNNQETHDKNVKGVESNRPQYLSFPFSSVAAVTDSSFARISHTEDSEDRHFYGPRALHYTHTSSLSRPVTTRTALPPSLRAAWGSLKVSEITVFAGISASARSPCTCTK